MPHEPVLARLQRRPGRQLSELLRSSHLLVALCLLPTLLPACSDDGAEPPPPPPDARLEKLGRCARFNPQRNAYFGDTHIHTALSLDANLQGNRLTPSDAYRFARGDAVGIQPYDANGEPLRSLQLSRPLDFVALSDHAEFLGLVYGCTTPDSPEYSHDTCQTYRDNPDGAFLVLNIELAPNQGDATGPELCEGDGCRGATLSAWSEVQASAEAAYDRSEACAFTSFVAYEWSGAPGTRNLHRNVIFRNHVVPELPASYFDDNFEEGLWSSLRQGCLEREGSCDALTIPHNSNLSDGLMFEAVNDAGEPFDAAYATTRAQLEPLIEVFQHKGDSECLPGGMAGDELCDFEKLPYVTLATANIGGAPEQPAEPDFVRHALGKGLELSARLGVNPFQYGIIASTDTHLGTPGAVDEKNFAGHGGAGLTVRDALPPGLPDRAWFNPGGLAVLWAEENSREALFSAMRRREAYGTSGPRIVLRFFGGWALDGDLCDRTDMVEASYAGGVPMGGVLATRPDNAGAPRFVVSALRDTGAPAQPGTPLQRLQIIKAWLDGGQARFAVHEVAGDPNNGADVDIATCAPQGAGADSLCTVWTDPDFDPTAPTLYYARAIENPSCRWHTYLCNDGGVDCTDPTTVTEGFEDCCNFPATQQERAWSSPIWYGPEN
jgi:hypothetical protein